MSKSTIKLSQELDKLLNESNKCTDSETYSLLKVEIESKRKELYAAIEYNEYLNGVEDPRD